VLPPSSGYEMEAEVPPNRWYVSTILHGVISETSAILMFHVRLFLHFRKSVPVGLEEISYGQTYVYEPIM
jgi:hypothetical protein